MKVEVLASVMNASLRETVQHMNLQSDAVIINQCDRFGQEEMQISQENGEARIIRFYSFPDRGIGRSRNEAILRAEGDICLFSDADIVYEDGYETAILAEFEKNPQADMIIFNIEVEESRRTYHITERKRVHWYNCGRYGAVRVSLLASGSTFSLLFGGGAKYSNGEDSLFLTEFIQKGYKVYTAPVTIGREEAGDSTWFHGYNEKFFHDRGVLYHYLYGRLAGPLALRFLYAHKGILCSEVTIKQAKQWMRDGIREARKRG
jgi:glycosyltransferase involved in cell wall biosynthesis